MANKKDFRFVETERSKGIIEVIKQMAKDSGRSFNNYIERILKTHVDNKK
jgi:hypothetical protein